MADSITFYLHIANCIISYLPTYLPTYLHTYLSTYLPVPLYCYFLPTSGLFTPENMLLGHILWQNFLGWSFPNPCMEWTFHKWWFSKAFPMFNLIVNCNQRSLATCDFGWCLLEQTLEPWKQVFFYPQEKVHCEDVRLLDCLKYNLNLVHQMFEEMALLHISREKKNHCVKSCF